MVEKETRFSESAAPLSEEDLSAWVREKVGPNRFRHIQGVVETAGRLARRFGEDPRRARWAGWFHDAAKEMNKEKLAELIRESPYTLDPIEQTLPALWHPYAGAWLAERDFGVRDRGVLEAVLRHTLGHPQMSLLAQILFVADYIEPSRTHKGVEEVRRAAQESLTRAVVLKAQQVLAFLREKNVRVHPRLSETLQSFSEKAAAT